MGPVNSVTYNVSDEEKGEVDEFVTLSFKAAACEARDRIRSCFDQLSEEKISAIMTSVDNTKLKEAFEHLHKKHGSFPFSKEEYEPYINDILKDTAEPDDLDGKSDLELLCDAWISDMVDFTEDLKLYDGF